MTNNNTIIILLLIIILFIETRNNNIMFALFLLISYIGCIYYSGKIDNVKLFRVFTFLFSLHCIQIGFMFGIAKHKLDIKHMSKEEKVEYINRKEFVKEEKNND
jgi:predicted membrane protein